MRPPSGPVVVTRALDADRGGIAEIAALCNLQVDVERELGRDWARLWVARLGPRPGPLAGMLLAWQVADELHLIDVGTRPECRRRGVGRALVDRLLDHARTARLRLVVLEVRRSNAPALALYRTAGFDAVAVRESYYSNPAEDAIVMQLEFDFSTGRQLRPASDAALPDP